jgi:hypothetical protein
MNVFCTRRLGGRGVSGSLPLPVIVLLLAGCAGQAPPMGGPVDTVPPVIVRTFPDSAAVRVKPDHLELEFSKYVDRRSVEESIFISPYLGEMEFDWSGTEVSIKFSEPLRDGITYVLNVGTDVVDVRARNRMASGFSLAFSTGDSIDRGGIAGRVFDEKAEGVMIFAYALRNHQGDTLSPSRVRPDYITQTGKGGFYNLSYLAFGVYRVFAIGDEYHNILYDRETDRYGVLGGDVSLSMDAPQVSDLDFRLSKEDTTKPFVTSATGRNVHTVQVRFNEALDSLCVPEMTFALCDTASGTPVGLLSQYLEEAGKPLVTLITRERLDSSGVYRVTVRNARDCAGNQIDTLHSSAVFSGTSTPDTLRPAVALEGVSDSARGIRVDAPLRLAFSKPVRREQLTRAIQLADTLGRTVRMDLDWLDPVRLLLRPRAPLSERTDYRLRVTMDSVRDLHGASYRDSVLVMKFRTQDLRMTGSISGVLAGVPGRPPAGPVYVSANALSGAEGEKRTARLPRPGAFTIDRLFEGKYVVSAFLDEDSSATYNFGKPYPFLPSERFAVYKDTVKVRARWSVENVMLQLH